MTTDDAIAQTPDETTPADAADTDETAGEQRPDPDLGRKPGPGGGPQLSNVWVYDGRAYDLTEWIGQHPGGSQRILPLCGTDATAAFSAQHGGQARPASELAAFLLGPLLG